MKYNIITVDPLDLKCADSLLRVRTKQIESINNSIYDIIAYMSHCICSSSYATGLSAIQLGIPLRLFVINLSRMRGKELIAINPEIDKIAGSWKKRSEGCLSLPNYKGIVKRRDKISFNAMDSNGKIFKYEASGYEAAVLQHEFDHLDGILYWDKMNENYLPIKM